MYNRTMRIIVFFDLPVTNNKDRKNYTAFRKALIKEGFSMMQFSVYVRIVRNHDDARKYLNRVKNFLPPIGSVRAMIVTEKQYNSMILLVGEKTATEQFLTSDDIIEV